MNIFKALIVNQQSTSQSPNVQIQEMASSTLPEGDVLVAVAYSSLNYKDGLAVTGKGRIISQFPMIPGIDLAGIVQESSSSQFNPGDPVLLTGWGVGENHWGGYAQLAKVKSDWLIPLPSKLSLKQAMGIGTAGLTAMLCIMALENNGLSFGKEVVVTGASGGVGSIAVTLLAQLGYSVIASTGSQEETYLKKLGATRIIDRQTLSATSNKPLKSEQWDGAIDTVGGETLAGLLRTISYGASIAACGLAGGSSLNTTVLPFILRGVYLLGVDSVLCPKEKRQKAWKRLENSLSLEKLDQMIQVIKLAEVSAFSQKILSGEIRGRIVVDLEQKKL